MEAEGVRVEALLATVLLTTSTLPAVGAAGVAPDAGPEPVPAAAEDEMDRSRALVEDLHAADPPAAVERVAAEAGFPATDRDPPDLSAEEALQRMADRTGQDLDPATVREELDRLPADLRDALDRILSAVVHAQDLRDAAFADLSPEEMEVLRTRARTGNDGPGDGWVAEARDGTGAPGDAPAAPSLAGDEPGGDLAEQVDRARLAEAEAVLLEAVQEERPTLEGLAQELDPGTASPASDAPPTLLVAPFLAVDLAGDTHHVADVWVSVDLEGSDTYENNAGGTFVDLEGNSDDFFAPVALAVDVAGDDTYAVDASTGTMPGGPLLAVQGAGFLGVGALVDVAGADAYNASLSLSPAGNDQPDTSYDASLQAQGAGQFGAGVLVDPLGPNTYEARTTTEGGDASTTAQGGGLFGVGLNLGNAEAPGAGTTYVAEATSVPHVVEQTQYRERSVVGGAQTVAHGGGGTGAAALVDAAGDDDYAARSSGGAAVTGGQGGGTLGAGVLADAAGEDRIEAAATVDPHIVGRLDIDCPENHLCSGTQETLVTMGDAYAQVQGYTFAGVGVLADEGVARGRHIAEATNTPTGEAVATCGGAGTCGTLDAIADVEGGSAIVEAQGAAVAGAGVLLGSAGPDDNLVSASSSPEAVASISGGDQGTCEATAAGGASDVGAQGAGYLAGAGLLADPAGDDAYTGSQATSASATACDGSGSTSTTAGAVNWLGQGAAAGGAGVLADGLGSDAYSATGGTSGADGAAWSNGGLLGFGLDAT